MSRLYHVEALARGLAILDCFIDGPAQLSLGEITERVGLNKATVFRLIHGLQAAGYVRHDNVTKRYSLSFKVLDLNSAVISALEFPVIAQPALEELHNKLQESINLGVLDGTETRYVARVHSRRLMSINLEVGSKLPTHATSMGKVLLASLDDDEVRALYDGQELYAYTPSTITSVDALIESLDEVRKQGFATTYQELEVGLCAASAPVYGRDGKVIAAVNASTFTSRASPEQLLNEFVPAVRETAMKISKLLGYEGRRLPRPTLAVATGTRNRGF